MRSFQKRFSEFTARGVHIAAISVDSVEINRGYAQKMGFTFPLLSDAGAGVIRRYDVLHRGAGPKNTDIARPAEFYVDANGTALLRLNNFSARAGRTGTTPHPSRSTTKDPADRERDKKSAAATKASRIAARRKRCPPGGSEAESEAGRG
ncbi:MAG: hypothetical protein DME35_11515 [Verrucomicrobia bacterium]|nr:MAG: hypothetical protein DME35_11515 [Verrucomicrobiota bacterium]